MRSGNGHCHGNGRRHEKLFYCCSLTKKKSKKSPVINMSSKIIPITDNILLWIIYLGI
ncbi:hypothetical protein ENTCAN_05222 [Enterobacter cancerogenus ATCC 35316]|nr:hypothetical protein ENTCAN_05222 [Enterobacter cancerogenus ATCC 35316]